jgi:leucyl-tRNA synthetase
MKTVHKVVYRLMTCVAASAMLVLLSQQTAAQSDENPQVTQLLTEARDKAAVLSKDADEMESLIRTDASWQTHATMLEQVKEHVNDLGRIAEKLKGARESAAPWQQKAIDRMLPELKELANNTTAAIQHLNENKTRPTTGNYAEYLKENTETAHQLSSMISSFVKYGQTRAKLEKLEQRLEVASK